MRAGTFVLFATESSPPVLGIEEAGNEYLWMNVWNKEDSDLDDKDADDLTDGMLYMCDRSHTETSKSLGAGGGGPLEAFTVANRRKCVPVYRTENVKVEVC